MKIYFIMRYLTFTLALLVSLYVIQVAKCQSFSQLSVLASDGAAEDEFGKAIAVDGNRVVVGAPKDDNANGSNAGAVYVYEYDGSAWQETKLISGFSTAGDQWGSALSISGDRIAVGAYNDDSLAIRAGSVSILEFDGTNWVETEKILASDGDMNDWFGDAISLDGERLAIGAQRDEKTCFSDFAGSVYIYDYDGTDWNETVKLDPLAAGCNEIFGSDISLDGDRLAVGSYSADYGSGLPNAGAIYIFDYDGTDWNDTVLVPVTQQANAWVGWSIALDGDRVAAGALLQDNALAQSGGVVYVWDFDGADWNETLIEPTLANEDQDFGWSVALHNDTLIVGARHDDDNGVESGAIYLFTHNAGGSWNQQKVLANNGAGEDEFGSGVAIEGERVFASAAKRTNVNGNEAGELYILSECTPGSSTLTVTSCDDYTWNLTNQTYDQSGQYQTTVVGPNGCDSVITLDLTIQTGPTASFEVTACDEYTWAANGQSYTNTGAYTTTVSNPGGNFCDSVLTLNLTINNSSSELLNLEIEPGGSVDVNGEVYDTPGNYTQTLVNAAGCDSTLNIIIELVTGLPDESASVLSIYPNPTDGEVVIAGELPAATRAEVYSLSGRRVMQPEVVGNRLDISALPEGMYLLKLSTPQRQFVKRIVIH